MAFSSESAELPAAAGGAEGAAAGTAPLSASMANAEPSCVRERWSGTGGSADGVAETGGGAAAVGATGGAADVPPTGASPATRARHARTRRSALYPVPCAL